MATVEPPFDDGYREEAYAYYRRGVNTALIIAIGAFAVLSMWAALAVFSRIDRVLFPGNELGLPFVQSVVPGVEGKPPEAAETIEQRTNILVMGLDRRFDEAEGQPYRTDSVMVLTIDPYKKTAGALSFPRDMRVDVKDPEGNFWTRTRINVVYEMGQNQIDYPFEYEGGGAQLAMDTINDNFGIPIDFYAIIDWNDFVQIVDDLGGIDVDVPEYAYDPAYSTCQFCGEYYPLEFVPGPEHMDGQRALDYARIRKSDNDYKRVGRQQLIIRSIATKAKSLNWLDVGKAKDLYGDYRRAIDTNIPDLSIPGLARLAQQVDLANAPMVSLGPATYPCPAAVCGGAAELEWYPRKMEELKSLVFNDGQINDEGAKILILNGTDYSTFATDFGQELQSFGVPARNITPDNYANGLLYPTTVIVNVSGGNPHTIEKLLTWLNLDESRVLSAADPQAAQFLAPNQDIIVVLGGDAVEDYDGGFNVTPPPEEPVYEEPVFEEPTPVEEEPTPEVTATPDEEEPTPEPEPTEVPTEPPAEEEQTGG